MFTMTAVVGGIVAARFPDPAFKKDVARKLAWLGIGSAIAGVLVFRWYLTTLPDTALLVMHNRLPDWFPVGVMGMLAAVGVYFLATLIQPRLLVASGAAAMTLVVLVFGLWPGEVARESIRKPWVAGQYVYSNQVIGRDVPGRGIQSEIPLIEERGFLQTLVFLPEALRQVTPDNAVEAGRVLALTTCSNCHSLSPTGMRPLRDYFPADVDQDAIVDYLHAGLASGNTLYMPQIPFTDDEAFALASYLATLSGPDAGAAPRTARQADAPSDLQANQAPVPTLAASAAREMNP